MKLIYNYPWKFALLVYNCRAYNSQKHSLWLPAQMRPRCLLGFHNHQDYFWFHSRSILAIGAIENVHAICMPGRKLLSNRAGQGRHGKARCVPLRKTADNPALSSFLHSECLPFAFHCISKTPIFVFTAPILSQDLSFLPYPSLSTALMASAIGFYCLITIAQISAYKNRTWAGFLISRGALLFPLIYLMLFPTLTYTCIISVISLLSAGRRSACLRGKKEPKALTIAKDCEMY